MAPDDGPQGLMEKRYRAEQACCQIHLVRRHGSARHPGQRMDDIAVIAIVDDQAQTLTVVLQRSLSVATILSLCSHVAQPDGESPRIPELSTERKAFLPQCGGSLSVAAHGHAEPRI